MLTAAVVVAAVLALAGYRCMVVVPAGTAYVVERLGRYRATLSPGLHVLAPFVDRVAFRFSLRPKEQELTETCITLDNVPVSLVSKCRWQILDPERAAYAVADRDEFMAGLVKSAQRHWISARKEDDVRGSTRELEADVARSAAEAASTAGMHLQDVSVQRIDRTV